MYLVRVPFGGARAGVGWGWRRVRNDGRDAPGGEETYSTVNDFLTAGIIVNVDCDASQGGDFGGKLIQAGVVLPSNINTGTRLVPGRRLRRDIPFSLVGVRHGCCGYEGFCSEGALLNLMPRSETIRRGEGRNGSDISSALSVHCQIAKKKTYQPGLMR